jgi:hypothetical protein
MATAGGPGPSDFFQTTLRVPHAEGAPAEGAPGPSHLGTGDTTNPMRANSERLAAPQVLADYSPLRRVITP